MSEMNDVNAHIMCEHDDVMKNIEETRCLLLMIIEEIRDSENKEKFLYGSDLDLYRQWLKPIWDLCNQTEKLIDDT